MSSKPVRGAKRKKTKKQKIAKVANQKAKWQYCFQTKEYQFNEIVNGKYFRISLNASEFYSMNTTCMNHIERAEWLANNNKRKKHVAKE